MLHIDVYYANIATLSCRMSKRNAAGACPAEAEAEGAAAAAGRAWQRPVGEGLWAGPGGGPGSLFPGKFA